MKEEEKQQEKEEEAEVKEEVPGGNPEDESSRTCYIDHPLRKKKERGRTRESGRPSKAVFFCLPRSVGLPRSEPALEGSLQFTLFLFPALADGYRLNGRRECPDSRTCGLYRTREYESGRIVDQTTT